MFWVKQLVKPFLLPPGCFIGLILAVGAVGWVRGRRRAGAASVGAGVILWVLSLPMVSGALMAHLESGLSPPVDPEGDVIVVLGGGASPDAPDLTGMGRPSEGAVVRLATAARLYRIRPLPVIVSGGAPLHSGATEASLASRFLRELGIPAAEVLEEGRSRDTAENAAFTAEICRYKGWHRLLLVTHGYHMKRAADAFRRQGLSVTPVPVALHPRQVSDRSWTEWLPGDFRELSDALHEVLGRAYHRWTFEG